MPKVEWELSKEELNQINNKVTEHINKEIERRVKIIIKDFMEEKANDYLSKVLAPAVSAAVDKFNARINDSSLDKKIEKIATKRINSLIRNEDVNAIASYCSTVVKDKLQDKNIHDELMGHIETAYKYNLQSLQNNYEAKTNAVINNLIGMIHTIHRNQDFLATKIGVKI